MTPACAADIERSRQRYPDVDLTEFCADLAEFQFFDLSRVIDLIDHMVGVHIQMFYPLFRALPGPKVALEFDGNTHLVERLPDGRICTNVVARMLHRTLESHIRAKSEKVLERALATAVSYTHLTLPTKRQVEISDAHASVINASHT